jgi:hypothetical protein
VFDRGFGVDVQDILSILQINFSSFQLFIDQNNYRNIRTQSTPPSVAFDKSLQMGIEWILAQANLAVV